MIEFSNKLDFNKSLSRELTDPCVYRYGKEWPVVYMIYNDDEVYIGETVDASIRMAQHIKNRDRQRLKKVLIISDETYNKSVIQDLESYLISHAAADTRFKQLQNGNAGHQKHNYYNKEVYEASFKSIWDELIKKYQLAEQEVSKIENSNIFKYSPYKTLTTDQYDIARAIITHLADDLKKEDGRSFFVNGAPGTGKTILGIYLMKLLTTKVEDDLDSDDEVLIEKLKDIHMVTKGKLKIGIVVSMENLRKILKDTFKHVHGLNAGMVLSPSEVARSKEIYDVLIVDEAHRLKARRNMSGFELKTMGDNNTALGLDEKSGTQLDWIIARSKNQVFFYDRNQSIKKTDIDENRIISVMNDPNNISYSLSTQIRCFAGGDKYIEYIKQIFSNRDNRKRMIFDGYDVRMFSDVDEMVQDIREKDKEFGLCRTVAGYAWDWKTKDKINPTNLGETNACIARGMYDIEIDGHKYIWNVHFDGWVSTPNSVNEIGCIHTIQGFDLNYAGVIIGDELKYNPETGKIYVDRASYRDSNGKNSTNDEELLQYIFNIYSVLCTRGIKGTYIYVCNPELREYLSNFFDVEE